MEVAELVLKYLQALAWPAVALIAVITFRRQLASLFGRVTEASLFGATVKLERSAEQAEAASRDLPELESVPEQTPSPKESDEDRSFGVGRVVLEWRGVERVTGQLAERLGLPARARYNVRMVVDELVRRDLLSRESAELSRQLQSLRNRMVHDDDNAFVTASTAESFVDATHRLRAVLQIALEKLDPQSLNIPQG